MNADEVQLTISPLGDRDLITILAPKNLLTKYRLKAIAEFFSLCSPDEGLAAMHKLIIHSGFLHPEPFTVSESGALLELLKFLSRSTPGYNKAAQHSIANVIDAIMENLHLENNPEYVEPDYVNVPCKLTFTKKYENADFTKLLAKIDEIANEYGVEFVFSTE